jgi:hypothetical protein
VAFLAALRLRLCAASGGLLLVAESIVGSLICFSLPQTGWGRHIHHSGSEKQQVESVTIIRRAEKAGRQAIGGCRSFFMDPTKHRFARV